MPKKLKICVAIALFFAFGVPLAFTSNPEMESKSIPIPSTDSIAEVVVDSPRVLTECPTIGMRFQMTSGDINPEVGIVVQHDEVGSTWYEYQNHSVGRMITVGPDAHKHMLFTEADTFPYPPAPRYVSYNCKDPLDNWLGATRIDGGAETTAGFANIAVLNDGIEVVLYHRKEPSDIWHSLLAIEESDSICSGGFAKLYDIPNRHAGTLNENRGIWPKGGVVYDAEADTEYIHIVTTDRIQQTGEIQTIGYQRCVLLDDSILCYSPVNLGPYSRLPGQIYPSPDDSIAVIDSIKTISAITVNSPVSDRVAIVYTKNRQNNDVNNDVVYIESMNNGEDWLNGIQWPPVKHNITNYPTSGTERAYWDVSACYDSNDSLHIVWIAAWFDSASGMTSNDAKLYHWSKEHGTVLITSAYWGGTAPGTRNRNISKMSLSAMDPIYHPGSDPDSVYLYCIWTQFDSADNALNGFTNGDIYGAASSDGGASWGPAYNLTNTKTPNCLPGECLSEHWSSLAQILHNGNLHIQYVCDRDAGAVIFGEGDWTRNPVMYLELEAWMPGEAPLIANFSAIPTSGVVPCTVQFTDLSSGNPTFWFWDFGDDSTSTDSCPVHTYNDTGCFDVKLVVSNQTDTDSTIRENYIHVFLTQITPGDFIADFESGNIANVQHIGFDSFTFEIRLDDQHGDTYGWYYFAIVNNNGRTITLFLSNPDGWQNETCNPLFSNDNRHWERVADVWRQGNMIGFRQYLGADTVWFAQGFPFTVTQMYAYLDTIEGSPQVQRQTLGYSVHNHPIDMVTITDNNWPDERKKTAWLISRQHPMESPPTFLLRGLFDWVLEDSEFSRYWLKDIILKVVPIVNVDGVVEGYSRHNVNGINLNRNWQENIQAEEPEVKAVHQAIDDYLNSGNHIDFFMDLHAAPDNYDFGFRMSLGYTDSNYFHNQETFLYLLETYDPWQNRTRWRDLDTSYAAGVSCVTLYDMYDLDTYSSENPWTRREDNSFITIETLLNQGPACAKAIYDYLYPLTVYDTVEMRIDSIVPGESFLPKVWDFDQKDKDSLLIAACCYESSDSELVVLYRENDTGLFSPSGFVPTDESFGTPGDGIVSLLPWGELVVAYVDPDIPSRICNRILEVDSTGNYICGDANGDGSINVADVVYLINYLFAGGPAPDPLWVGDANCDQVINIADVIYMINYLFAGGPPPGCL